MKRKKIFSISLFILLFLQIISLLYFADNDYTDGWNLRQAQTAMIVRNIEEDGLDFLPTRLDFFAPRDGHVILEFPLIHTMTAILNHFLGEQEANGRILVLLFHILNVIIMYLIFSKMFSKLTANVFAVIYSFTPIVFYSAHAFIPETSMMFLYLLGFYFFIRGGGHNLSTKVIYRLSLAAAPLLKPLAGVLYFPILAASFARGRKHVVKEVIALGLCSMPFLCWMIYGYLINNSVESAGDDWANWSSILLGRGGIIGNWINLDFYLNVGFSLLFLNATPLILVLAGWGIYKKVSFANKDFLNIWTISNIVLLFIFAGANRGHPYYQIYFVPIFLIYAAAYVDFLILEFGESKISKWLTVIIVAHVTISSIVFAYAVDETKRINNLEEFKQVANQYVDLKSKNKDTFVLIQAERLTSGVYDYYLKQYTQQFSLRHHPSPGDHLNDQVAQGAKYLFMINTSYGETIEISQSNLGYWNWLESNASQLYQSESIILFELL